SYRASICALRSQPSCARTTPPNRLIKLTPIRIRRRIQTPFLSETCFSVTRVAEQTGIESYWLVVVVCYHRAIIELNHPKANPHALAERTRELAGSKRAAGLYHHRRQRFLAQDTRRRNA